MMIRVVIVVGDEDRLTSMEEEEERRTNRTSKPEKMIEERSQPRISEVILEEGRKGRT